LADWVVGMLLVGVALATTAGLVIYAVARCWRSVNSNRPEGPPPPSLGSRTSAPLDPTP
jgi:hypothetical protein